MLEGTVNFKRGKAACYAVDGSWKEDIPGTCPWYELTIFANQAEAQALADKLIERDADHKYWYNVRECTLYATY